MIRCIPLICCVARGSAVGGNAWSAAMSSWIRLVGACGQRLDGLAVLCGSGDDLVVNVSDIANIGDVFELQLEQAEQYIEDHDWSGIADMGKVVDRWAADIEAHGIRFQRLEQLLAAAQGIVQVDWQYRPLTC